MHTNFFKLNEPFSFVVALKRNSSQTFRANVLHRTCFVLIMTITVIVSITNLAKEMYIINRVLHVYSWFFFLNHTGEKTEINGSLTKSYFSGHCTSCPVAYFKSRSDRRIALFAT